MAESHGDTDRRAATRVLVVDDHAIVRSGLRRLLEEVHGFQVVAEAADVTQALDHVRAARPEVVVVDGGLPHDGRRDLVQETRRLGVPMVVLSAHDAAGDAHGVFDAGAQGYVLADAAEAQLVDAIRAVLAGRLYADPQVAARLALGQVDDGLTDRQLEVLRSIALGYTNQETAGRLHLSVRTVEAHRRHILQKLRLQTRAELVRYAHERGLVSPAAT